MSKISDQTRISTADSAPYHAHPSIFSDHFTSQCFMRPAPIACIENIPKRKASIKVESFARFAPMPRAVFGRTNVYNRAFFVPFRSVFRHFNEFVVSSPSSTAIGTTQVIGNVPKITSQTILEVFLYDLNLTDANSQLGAFGTMLASSDTSSVFDFEFTYGNYNRRLLLNDQGIYLYKVLRALGYPVYWDINTVNKSSSILPLLCFIKVHLDWYYPSAFAYSNVFAYFEEFFENASPLSTINVSNLAQFFLNIAYCSYNQDYFTSSWTNPVGPNSSNFEGRYAIPDIANSYPFPSSGASSPSTINNVDVVNTANLNGTPSVESTTTVNVEVPYRLNQYILDALRSLTDYTVRHRLSGVRAVDRTLAEIGVNLASELMKRSYYCGYSEFPCQFGDNMSTADTSGARLGDYSGKGVAYDRGAFQYDAYDERGMYLIVNSVVPQVGYFQGYDRHVDHIYNLDFYHGDFDHLGVQALSVGEVAGMAGNIDLRDVDKVFGFVPRYGEYLVYNDHVTGMPSLPSVKSEYDGMYMQRNLNTHLSQLPANSTLQQRLEFVLAQDYQQFNRLFYNEKRTADNIDFIHHFTIEFVDNAKDLFDTYDFEKQVNAVKMNINGTNVQ